MPHCPTQHQENPSVSAVLTDQDKALILQKTLENAQKTIEKMVDGNGMHKSAVRISEKNIKISSFEIHCHTTLKPVLKETHTGGLQATGTELPNRDALNDAIDLHMQHLVKAPEMLEKLAKNIGKCDFGLKNDENLIFPQAQKSFYFKENCQTCQGKGQSDCSLCQGRGTQACNQCQGQGNTNCLTCKGTKQLPNNDGTFRPCEECKGLGHTPCPGCRQSGTISCRSCQGQGISQCNGCNGSGYKTVIITVDFEMGINSRFHWPEGAPDHLPGSEHDIILKKYARISPTALSFENFENNVKWRFSGGLPTGKISFSLNGKRVDATVIGLNGHIETENLFLDSLVKPGISALNKIARGPMATGALFQRARSYRMIKDVTDRVSHMPRRKILHQIRQDYPLGLSDKYAKAMIKLADDAVKKITIKPRWIGAGISIIVFALVINAWFHLGLRPDFIAQGSLNLQLFLDTIWLGLGCVLAAYIIKKTAQINLRNILGDVPKKMPASGDQALVAYGGMALVFLIAGATSPENPLWWTHFF